MYKKTELLILVFVLFTITFSSNVQAQQKSIRTAVKGGQVYVYNVELPPPGQGFNIYRKGAGSDSLVKLNKQPVVSAAYPQEFRQMLGNLYPQIQEALQTDNPTATMFRLRSDQTSGLLYSFLYPRVAQALGRLFIDTTATIGQKALYKIVFVNDLGQPTGEVLKKNVSLKRQRLSPPTKLSADNNEDLITLSWHYPKSDEKNDDRVIRFNVYRSFKGDSTIEKLNGSKVILRLNNKTTFKYKFKSSQVGRQVDYFVSAVSITGQEGQLSKPLTYKVKNNVPPGPVLGIQGAYYQGGALITWATNTAWDLMGYNIYRSQKVHNGYHKINKKLINGSVTAYMDSLVTVGKKYYYKVTAVDSANNESEKSIAVNAYINDNVPPPPANSITAVYSDSGYVRLHWSTPSQSKDFKTWMVLQQSYTDSSNLAFTRMDQGHVKTNHFKDDGLINKGFNPGGYYRFGVASIDSSDNTSDTVMTVIQIPDHQAPAPPSFLTAVNHDGVRVNLVWNASTSIDANRYRLYRIALPAAKDTTLLQTLDIRQRSYRDEKIMKGRKYVYAVTDVDTMNNESKPTLSDTVLVKDYVAPRKVLHVRIDTSGSTAKIIWEKVAAYDLAGYKVYRSKIQTGTMTSMTDTLIHSSELALPVDRVKGYWFRIKAIDTSGNESKPSEPVSLIKMSSY